MSEHRLRQGHHEPRNLWQHHADEPPASKSGECVGQVFDPDLAAEICTAVNAARDGRVCGHTVTFAGQPLACTRPPHADAIHRTDDGTEWWPDPAITKSAAGSPDAELETLRALVRDLADPDPCHYDHHGYCQAHGWFETDPPCPHGRARQLAGDDTDATEPPPRPTTPGTP